MTLQMLQNLCQRCAVNHLAKIIIGTNRRRWPGDSIAEFNSGP